MTLQIILTAFFYLLIAGILVMMILMWRTAISNTKKERENQARLVESITVAERSVKSAEEIALSVKQAVVVMQHLTEVQRHTGETTYE